MKLLDLLNWILSQSNRLPEIMGLIDDTVALLKRWSQVFSGDPATATAMAMQVEALSADETAAVQQVQSKLQAAGISPKRLTDALPYLKLLLQLAGGSGLLGPVLQKLLDVISGKLSAQSLNQNVLTSEEANGLAELAAACSAAKSGDASAQAIGDGTLLKLLLENIPTILKLLELFGIKLPTWTPPSGTAADAS